MPLSFACIKSWRWFGRRSWLEQVGRKRSSFVFSTTYGRTFYSCKVKEKHQVWCQYKSECTKKPSLFTSEFLTGEFVCIHAFYGLQKMDAISTVGGGKKCLIGLHAVV